MSAFIADFDLGEIVYLKTDPDQQPRMVTEVSFWLSGGVGYQLSCGTSISSHYALELSREKLVEVEG